MRICLPSIPELRSQDEGHLTFSKTPPVNRGAIVIADTLIWLPIALPGWRQTVHHILPLDSMAQIIRTAFTSDAFSVGVVPYFFICIN